MAQLTNSLRLKWHIKINKLQAFYKKLYKNIYKLEVLQKSTLEIK